jgi:pimeloyl-ACP methyl ester carboxylesterase
MTDRDILLIHGTWGHGGEWDEWVDLLTPQGFRVHAPSYRHHGRPGDVGIWTNSDKIAKLRLQDYVDDFVALVETMDTPPIIVGHSLGGLLAQLVAARVPHAGVVLLATAPAAGVFNFYPSSILLWGGYIPTWVRGRPMFPIGKRRWDRYVCNTTSQELGDAFRDGLCAESGTAYRQMVFWYFDRSKGSRVDFDAVTGPVLSIAGAEDKCTPPGMCRQTSGRYGSRGTYVEFEGSDHMMIAGTFRDRTISTMVDWIDANDLR